GGGTINSGANLVQLINSPIGSADVYLARQLRKNRAAPGECTPEVRTPERANASTGVEKGMNCSAGVNDINVPPTSVHDWTRMQLDSAASNEGRPDDLPR